ncbi:hypothetical protein TCAL_15890 [Tigriopus californicus]|uniref:Peripheral subunit-binding (PSBD) domain-containing protein n=1 Tax=Tigriopus californicus TaxID=6832 RepID=A0A553NNM3_TIGCA|nr:hypothetical protein TCAL_15890 [Tigriopus californicus]
MTTIKMKLKTLRRSIGQLRRNFLREADIIGEQDPGELSYRAAIDLKEQLRVQAGDILAEVETDKATMELEAYEDGTLLYIGVQEKEAALISPLAKKIGLEKGYDLSKIEGTGDGGRIIKTDIKQCSMGNKGSTTMHTSPMIPEAEGYQDIPISSMRHTIAKVFTESKIKLPHFYLTSLT